MFSFRKRSEPAPVPKPTVEIDGYEEIFYRSNDDLQLYARVYPAAGAEKGRPALCLPGLTRNSRDFHDLAMFLSQHPEHPRDVYAVDYRGRGLSDRDSDWENYSLLVEANDVLDLMAIAGLHKAAIVGTSRGGLIAMTLACIRPAAIGVVVLNDIGPVIETRGLARIASYVGKMPLPESWDDAAEMMREVNQKAFSAIGDAQWMEVARAAFNEKDGKPAPGYDPALEKDFEALDLSQPVPPLWNQFTALTPFPALVLRGQNSDLLSEETVAEMASRHPNLNHVTIPGEGHAPLLKDQESVEAVSQFLIAND
ncbi:alpha/beta hydrolase [Methyloligella sp. GL2]|nr:alpha/beta hydrolase [Methyloligella sp. GL2]